MIFLLFIIGAIVSFFIFDFYQYFNLTFLKENYGELLSYYQHNQFFFLSFFFLIYILVTALSLPGAAVLTLAAGAFFGLLQGLVIVSFASSLGATLAFLSSRFILRESVEKKFTETFQKINQGIKKEGALYLVTMRLIPIFPFFVINLVMGLTKFSPFRFYFVSQLTMLPGTFVYVNAGGQLSKINSLKDVASFEVLVSFTLLGLFPFVAKGILNSYKRIKIYQGYKKPKTYDYNMVVIGAGSAGLVTSYISAAVKAKVALIEKHKMGGDCLNTGCVPSKAIIRSAKLAHQMKNAQKYGLKNHQPEINFSEVMGRVHQVIKEIEPHDSVERYRSLGVECLTGNAQIISPWEVKVNGSILTTRNITIATGASPILPELKGIELVTPLTSENLWTLEKLPKRMIVVGGGPIGCEMTQSFQRLGSEVIQIERGDRLLKMEDARVSDLIKERFVKEGVQLYFSFALQEIQVKEGKKILLGEYQGDRLELEFDEILFAVGRKANITGFGLETLDIKTRDNQTIEANEYLQTNYPNIYVCGDVTGPYQLTHTASHQAWYCAVNSLFGKLKKFKVDYRVIPWATYTDPEVATVGLNEQMATKTKTSYELTTYDISDLDRAIADSEAYGEVRVLTKPGSDKILGATIVGNHAADLLVEFVAAMKHGFGLNKILSTIHVYPSMGEANKYAAGNWKKVQTSSKVLKLLEKFHSLSR